MSDIKNRETYTRVTTILYPFSGLDKIDPFVVSKAAERGTKVHKICEGIVSGLGEIGIDEETWGYVESFKKWWNLGHKVIEMEKRFWDDDLQVTGQVDFIIEDPSGLAIVDLKTSYAPSKTWPIQGAAYCHLARKAGYDIKEIYFLHLSKIGKEPKKLDYPTIDELYLASYKVWDHFYREKR